MPRNPKPKPNPKPKRTPSVPVRIPLDMAERADALRGVIPRETFIRDLVDKALRNLEESQ